MRTAFSIGALLLFLVLSLNVTSGSYDSWVEPKAESTGVSAGTSIRIFSCAAGLRPARFYTRRHYQGIFLQGKMYSHSDREVGLRVATWRPNVDGEEVQFGNFVLSESDADAAAFDEIVRTSPVDMILTACVRATASPTGEGAEARTERLAETFALLGSSEPPIDTKASWAFVAIRRPQGWVAISEKRSTVAGLQLTCNLVDDLSHYDDLSPPRVRGDAMTVSLYDTFDEQADPHVVSYEWFPVRRVDLRSIHAPTPFGEHAATLPQPASRAIWPFVRIRPGTSLEVAVGHRTDPGHTCGGVTFQVWLDDALVASRDIPFEPNVWHPWQVDLSGPERWAKLELRVLPNLETDWSQLHYGEPAAWGDPLIVHAYEPLTRSVRLSEDDFDLDGDGVVTRANMQDALWTMDVNRSGTIEAEEVLPGLVESMMAVDTNGDKQASVDEVDAWIVSFWAL